MDHHQLLENHLIKQEFLEVTSGYPSTLQPFQTEWHLSNCSQEELDIYILRFYSTFHIIFSRPIYVDII